MPPTTVPLLVKRVQLELRDLGATWADPDFICQVLSVKNDDLEQELQSLDLNFDEQVVIIPAIPANTTDLSAYVGPGCPLEFMVSPILLEWRLNGEDQEEWEVVPNVQKVVDTDTGTGIPVSPSTTPVVSSDTVEIESWEWRNGIIYISPSQSVVDLRVRFQALPRDITADAPYSPIRGVVNILVYFVCWSIALSRGGEASEKEAANFEKQMIRAKDAFIRNQLKPKMGQVQRLGGRRSGMPQGIGVWRPPTA